MDSINNTTMASSKTSSKSNETFSNYDVIDCRLSLDDDPRYSILVEEKKIAQYKSYKGLFSKQGFIIRGGRNCIVSNKVVLRVSIRPSRMWDDQHVARIFDSIALNIPDIESLELYIISSRGTTHSFLIGTEAHAVMETERETFKEIMWVLQKYLNSSHYDRGNESKLHRIKLACQYPW